ncbi:MAG: Rid family detoxifying hydrolase [Burkholderiaceae bacterium]|nr:Rid family detoxifying hydrolase [Burkholderiaceae bacterium]
MNKLALHTEQAPQPVGVYSQAIRAGNTVYLSGQLGINPTGSELQPDFAIQARQMFCNLRAVCQAAGGDLSNIVRLGVYLTDMADFPTLNQIMSEYFTAPYPARSVVQVVALPKAGVVEADAIMVI